LQWADANKEKQMKADCPFLNEDMYGPALAQYSAKSIDAAVGLLYALQAFASNVGLMKGMMPNICMQLYQNDIVGEEAFFAWREDTIDRSTPGKEKALQQTAPFFDYLQQSDDEDEEEDENEVDEALKDIPKPNNSSRL
jgi:eIF4-gamma/eIF5/eIF2-epsilon